MNEFDILEPDAIYCVDINEKPIKVVWDSFTSGDTLQTDTTRDLQELIDNVYTSRPWQKMYYYAHDSFLENAIKFFANNSSVVVVDIRGRQWCNGKLCNSTQVCSY